MRRTLLLAGALLVLGARSAVADLLDDATSDETALEARAGRMLVHGLAGDAALLAADERALEAEDEARRAAKLPPTGLRDNLRYLAAAFAPGRDAQRRALTELVEDDPDETVRRLAAYRLEADDAAAADRLLADDRHNRRAEVLNGAVRPLGIFSGAAFLAALNPFLLAGSAVDSIATTAMNLWHYNRLTTPEREALSRYGSLITREPHTQDAREIARAIRRLGAKRAAALCEETVQLGRQALDERDLDRAAFYLRDADGLEGCAERAAEPLRDLEEAKRERARTEEAALWPVDDPLPPPRLSEADDHAALLVATALGDPAAMVEAANRFRTRHPESPREPAVRYALAVARHLGGHPVEGRAVLETLAGDDDSSAGRHATAVLASADYAPLEAIGTAERQHARDTARYVLLGGRMKSRTALYGAAHLGAQGMRAAESLGIFNVIGLATRAWQAWRHDPVSNQPIIDRGEEFLARQPDGPEAAAVHARLADAYEREDLPERALMHLRALSDADPKRIARLEDKLAADLLKEAERGGGNPVLLEGIVRHFATTDAAETARKRLRERPEDGETVLSRELLETRPALLGPAALDLDPRLLDGERANGELAEAGVAVAPGELRLHLRREEGDGERQETRPLSPEDYVRARSAAQEALYASLLTAERRDPESGSLERFVPFFVQGAVDPGGGVYVYPGVKKRRYRSDDQPLYE